MTRVTIYQKSEEYAGFQFIGHAGYAAAGKDVICAGISTLVINTINSLEQLAPADKFELDANKKSTLISLRFKKAPSPEGRLLMDSLVLGLKGIQHSYGKKYISLRFQEVAV